MAQVTMSVEEYLTIMKGLNQDEAASFSSATRSERKKGRVKITRKGVSNPKMSRALVKANKMGKKKAGGFKKGWNQSKIMKKAHQLRRKM